MSQSVQNMYALAAGVWPRIAGFSNTPSLLVVALIANLVAVIPTAFRAQKENDSCQARVVDCAESASAIVPSD